MTPQFNVYRLAGKGGKPYYRITALNGEPVFTSEAYATPWNRDRAVKRLVKLGGGLFRLRPEVIRLPD
jgi:uncharacterized protein YegP (UPF0339 family)